MHACLSNGLTCNYELHKSNVRIIIRIIGLKKFTFSLLINIPFFTKAYLDGTAINEMQHYQDEAWRAICGQNIDLELQTFPGQGGSPTSEQWSPVSAVQYNHTSPLQQLHNAPGPIMLQPCYPVTSSTTAINVFTTPIGEPEPLPLNHVFTQPVYYQCIRPDCTQNVAQTNQLSGVSANADSSLQLLELVPLPLVGTAHTQIAAAETLLTLNTGEE